MTLQPRRRAALALVASVIAAHALLLAPMFESATPEAAHAHNAAAISGGASMRLVPIPGPAAAAVDAPPARQDPMPRPGSVVAAMNTPRPSPRRRAAPAGGALVVAPPTAPASPGPAEAAEGREWPRYATRLADPVRLLYRLQQGEREGRAELLWRLDAGRYELNLEGTLHERPVLDSASRGGIDADGLAPVRFVERRRGREIRAVNFRRDAGLISFSAAQQQFALAAAAQDRLSWIIQLAAVVEADPGLAQRGVRIGLFVAGTRGDAQTWVFEVQGREPLTLPAGAAPDSLHLRREPTRPYDTRVDVWLDPARQHLPVRAILTASPSPSPPLELRLVGADPVQMPPSP